MWRAIRIGVILAACSSCGCSSIQGGIIERINVSEARSSQLARDVGKVDGTGKSDPTIRHEPGIWLGRSLARVSETPLPPIFHQPATFERSVNSLAEFAERITLRSGIPTRVAGNTAQAGQGGAGLASLKPAGGGMPSLPGSMQGPVTGQTSSAVRIDFTGGSLKGLLDTVAARFGVSWKYANGAIQFFLIDTRTFQIAAVPGDAALSATVASGANSGGQSDGGGGGAGGNGLNTNNSQNTAVTSQLSVYSSIEKAVGIMLSAQGRVVASPATGSITVSDTPDSLERIAQFIDRENQALSRQVMVNVTVLAVTLTRGDNYGIKWDAVYQTLGRRYGLANPLATVANSNTFSAAILDTASSRLAGTSLLIEALAEQGRVRRETSASVVTLNNQPVPVQVAKQTTYLKSSQTTLTANVGSSTTLTPGTITAGFNMTILPHVLGDGTVMLQFSTDISSLRALRTVTSNSATIESPEIDTRNFLQRVTMKSSETLIISGFEQTDDNLTQLGTGSPSNLLFGGSLRAQANKEVIVILITPVVMNAS
ncbi:MAG: PilN family type IVB pilus formation outer membrane protein [Herminiimonas sp.]|nr:PilN family type IVB pilus formation outer membrane protein [Herminiimonas sp.]